MTTLSGAPHKPTVCPKTRVRYNGSISSGERGIFEGRLLALAKSVQHVGSSDNWGMKIDLREIVQAQVEPFSNRVSVNGPDIAVSAQQAQNVGLVIHELLTNASKYGALNDAAGKVEIAWQADRRDEVIRFMWKERDGAPVRKPIRTGFGTRFIRTILPCARIDYDPAGVYFEAEISLSGDAPSAQ